MESDFGGLRPLWAALSLSRDPLADFSSFPSRNPQLRHLGLSLPISIKVRLTTILYIIKYKATGGEMHYYSMNGHEKQITASINTLK